jgi:hypothetical protein
MGREGKKIEPESPESTSGTERIQENREDKMKKREIGIISILVIILALSMYGLSSMVRYGKALPEAYAAEVRQQLIPVDKEYLVIGATSGGLTASKYYNSTTGAILADYAYIVINKDSGGIIYSHDASNVASTDMRVAAAGTLTLNGFKQLQGFKAKRAASSDAGLHVHYFKLYY